MSSEYMTHPLHPTSTYELGLGSDGEEKKKKGECASGTWFHQGCGSKLRTLLISGVSVGGMEERKGREEKRKRKTLMNNY